MNYSSGRCIKVLHVTICRKLTSGQRKQLEYENLNGIGEDFRWEAIAIHSGINKNHFERRLPVLMRWIFLRNLYGWIYVLRNHKKYDFVLMRHIAFDPFGVVFSPFIKNRITIHHSKETYELPLVKPGLKGRLAAWLESILGNQSLKSVKAILGVTNEISKFQVSSRNLNTPISVYPNGIDLESIPIANDQKEKDCINICFICGHFSSWHGLDKLLEIVSEKRSMDIKYKINIHLIGNMSVLQENDIAIANSILPVFKFHGEMAFCDYKQIIDKCDFGLASFALERKNLLEASTLKVRELLAMGLPVLSGHIDTALPPDFKYYKSVDHVTIDTIISFYEELGVYDRNVVRRSSAFYINKNDIMVRLIAWLKSEFPKLENN